MGMPTAFRPRTFRIAGLTLDLRATVALVSTTLLLTIGHYQQPFPGDTPMESQWGTSFENLLLYLVVPLLLIRFVYGDSPRQYGFTFGNWRQGLILTLAVVGFALPLVAIAAGTPAMQEYYRGDQRPWPELIAAICLELIGWEFLFRGFLLFSLVACMGPTAVIAQAVPFALAHLGKPELETLSTVFGGVLFGWVAWRTRSYVYPVLIHLAVYTLTVFVAINAAGG